MITNITKVIEVNAECVSKKEKKINKSSQNVLGFIHRLLLELNNNYKHKAIK